GSELLRVQGTIDMFLEAFRHAENAVEGSPQLMAHAGEKLILEPGGTCQFGVGRSQLLATSPEGQLHLLALGDVAHDGREELQLALRVRMPKDQLGDRDRQALMGEDLGLASPHAGAGGGGKAL